MHAQNLPTSSFSTVANFSMKAACISGFARFLLALQAKKPITPASATPATMYGTLLDFLVNERLGSSALGSSMGPALYHVKGCGGAPPPHGAKPRRHRVRPGPPPSASARRH